MDQQFPTEIEPDPTQDISPKCRQVTEAAEQLFLAQGYGAVSMDQVARKAGVSKATLYAYFPSKDALFAQIVASKGYDNPLGDELFPAEVTDLRATLEAIGLRILEYMLRERTLAIYRIALAESARFPELGRAFYENGPKRFSLRFAAWLQQLQAQGLVEVEDVMLATQQFMALMRSGVFFRRSLTIPPEASAEEMARTVRAAADTFLKAFARRD
jgi:AcrR family transcriptional regulator